MIVLRNKFNVRENDATTTWFYMLNSVILQHVDSAKYLGIKIHKSLQFSEHINATAKKCSQRLGFLQRTLRQCPQEPIELAYISLVRSSAEHGAVAWDPFLKKDKQALEKIQNRATRWVSGDKRYQPASITKLRHQLKWLTLKQWRKHRRLSFMHKIMNGEVGITEEMLSLEDSDSRTWKKHRLKLKTSQGGQLSWRTPSLTAPSLSGTSFPPLWRRLPQPTSSRGSWLLTCPRQPQPRAQWLHRSLPVSPRPTPRRGRLFHAPTCITSSGCFMLHRTVYALWNLYRNPYKIVQKRRNSHVVSEFQSNLMFIHRLTNHISVCISQS